MYTKRVMAGLISAALLLCLCPAAKAAPTAELRMEVGDYETVDGGVMFTLNIGIDAPSEPYASLDFSIVSGNGARLHIVDLSEEADSSELAFEFTPEYGGVYHRGRTDETSGAVSYLVGLFSRESGNNIADASHICAVKLLYTGDSAVQLSLENLKLVYKNAEGDITGAPSGAVVSQSISPERFPSLDGETMTETMTPLAGAMSWFETASTSPVCYVAAVAALAIVALVYVQRTKRKAHGAK